MARHLQIIPEKYLFQEIGLEVESVDLEEFENFPQVQELQHFQNDD